MSRWAHRRDYAVSARVVLHWCDLADSAQCSVAVGQYAGTSPTPPMVGTNTFEMYLFLATTIFDRCVFDEHCLSRTGPSGGLFR